MKYHFGYLERENIGRIFWKSMQDLKKVQETLITVMRKTQTKYFQNSDAYKIITSTCCTYFYLYGEKVNTLFFSMQKK